MSSGSGREILGGLVQGDASPEVACRLAGYSKRLSRGLTATGHGRYKSRNGLDFDSASSFAFNSKVWKESGYVVS